jgi:hypothetical protein
MILHEFLGPPNELTAHHCFRVAFAPRRHVRQLSAFERVKLPAICYSFEAGSFTSQISCNDRTFTKVMIAALTRLPVLSLITPFIGITGKGQRVGLVSSKGRPPKKRISESLGEDRNAGA